MVTDPTAEQITEMTLLAAEAVRGFGLTPKAALVSHSSFGASDTASARKMRQALAMIRARAPGLEIDGEMHADAALVQAIRDRAVPDSRLSGSANLLVMPTLDAANISFNLLKAAADGLPVGPILLGMSKPIHVVVPSVTARGIVNLSALAVVEAQGQASVPTHLMLWLLLGAVVLFVLLGGMRAFERASVTSIKSLFAWIAALGGLSLALMLILTGRGGIALGALTLFGPLIYQRWQAARGRRIGGLGSGSPASPFRHHVPRGSLRGARPAPGRLGGGNQARRIAG